MVVAEEVVVCDSKEVVVGVAVVVGIVVVTAFVSVCVGGVVVCSGALLPQETVNISVDNKSIKRERSNNFFFITNLSFIGVWGS